MSSDGPTTPPAMTARRSGLRERLRDIVKPQAPSAAPQPGSNAFADPAAPAPQEGASSTPSASAPATDALPEAAGATPGVGHVESNFLEVQPAGTEARHVEGVDGTAALVTRRSSDSRSGVERVLGGEWRSHSRRQSFVVTRRFEPEQTYGRVRVGDVARALRGAASSARLLATERAQAPFVFFDLETTGLSGGAGTHAFLVGCSWFDDRGGFVIEQHLMTDFAAERVMLEVVSTELSKAGALVSFNGKSFDAPVLETRYLFHRLTSPCVDLPHLDMLHPARRFWGGDGERGCSLIALEGQLLGKARIDDVPGFEIPARYFEFIRSGNAQLLADVLEHNRLDLLSLAAVTARLLELVEQGADATDDAREALALGRVYERADDSVRAHAAFERAWRLSSQTDGQNRCARMAADWAWTRNGIRAQALRSLACVARRQRRYGDAARYWRHLVGVPGCPPQMVREATEALAIHHEHRERDLRTAKMFALRNLEVVAKSTRGDAVRHRLARLERKLLSEPPLFPSLPLLPSSDSPTSGRRTSS